MFQSSLHPIGVNLVSRASLLKTGFTRVLEDWPDRWSGAQMVLPCNIASGLGSVVAPGRCTERRVGSYSGNERRGVGVRLRASTPT